MQHSAVKEMAFFLGLSTSSISSTHQVSTLSTNFPDVILRVGLIMRFKEHKNITRLCWKVDERRFM